MTREQRDIKRKLAALRYAEECGNVRVATRSTGEAGLINKSPCPVNMPLGMSAEVEEKILHLRRTCH